MRTFQSLLAVLLMIAATFARSAEIDLNYTKENGWQTNVSSAAEYLLLKYILIYGAQEGQNLVAAVDMFKKFESKFDLDASSKNIYRLDAISDNDNGTLTLGFTEKLITDNVISDQKTIKIDRIYLGKEVNNNCIVLVVEDIQNEYAAFLLHPKKIKLPPNATANNSRFTIKDLDATSEDGIITIGEITEGRLQLENIYSFRNLGTVDLYPLGHQRKAPRELTYVERHR